MPSLDLTDLLSDPDFVTTFTVVSTTRDMSTGSPVDIPADPMDATGVVIPGKAGLRRLDDGSRLTAFTANTHRSFVDHATQ